MVLVLMRPFPCQHLPAHDRCLYIKLLAADERVRLTARWGRARGCPWDMTRYRQSAEAECCCAIHCSVQEVQDEARCCTANAGIGMCSSEARREGAWAGGTEIRRYLNFFRAPNVAATDSVSSKAAFAVEEELCCNVVGRSSCRHSVSFSASRVWHPRLPVPHLGAAMALATDLSQLLKPCEAELVRRLLAHLD